MQPVRRLCSLISNDYKYTVVGFVDDDIGKKSAVISGVKVFPREKVRELYHRLNVRKVILCIPNSSDSEIKAISRFFVDNGFGVLSIPRIDELLSGKARLHQSEMLDIANLTGRNEVERGVVPDRALYWIGCFSNWSRGLDWFRTLQTTG